MLLKGAQTLPNKVAHQYKQLAKFYDAKNYRKGLKNAEKILQTHPQHPETNAMKALFELGLGQQAKAQASAKFALEKSKMTSMFCWHTYGTVLKQKRSFAEAAKCFQMALNFDKDNMQILRQTASLQVHIRDHNNHVATRLKILKLKPNMIHNWIGFAIAQHLKGDFEQLYKALSSIQNLRASAEMKPIQVSHYQIYRAIAYIDGEKYEKGYEQLVKNKDKILDQDVWNQLVYKAGLKINKPEQSRKSISFLVKKYPENLQYIKQYETSFNLTPREVYKTLRTQFKSKIAQVYQLSFVEDPVEFKSLFAAFIKPYFQKNLISLFAEIQVLYERTNYSNIIQQVFLETEQSLRKNNSYPDGTASEFPTQHLWSIYLLAQHYSLNFLTLNKAYQYIQKAIEHTTTVTQFYIVKAQIQYKLHNNIESLKTINEARKTDLADRYMNNISIRFLMKCRKPHIAEDVLKLFMRDEASLYELQNQWYIIEAGKSFLKQRNFAAGLRHLYFVEKQFQDIEANQYDFHTYCIRKWTLKEYLEYINFNENLYKDKKYAEAAGYAIENLFEYAHFLEQQMKKPKEEVKEDEGAKKKKKKKKAKQANEQEDLTPVELFRKKIDYFGKEYSEKIKANPLQQAFSYARNITSAKFINKLNKKQNRFYGKAFSGAIRVFIHFNKPLMAIRAHKKLVATDFDSFSILYSTVKLVIFLQACLGNEKIAQLTKQLIKQYLGQVLGDFKNAEQLYNSNGAKLPSSYHREIRMAEIQLALKGQDSRQNFIILYKSELNKIIQSSSKDISSLQVIFYLVHRLEFFDEFSKQTKDKLNALYGELTSYFSQWSDAVDKLPASTWGMFWLSDYDIKREQEKQQDGNKTEQESKKIQK